VKIGSNRARKKIQFFGKKMADTFFSIFLFEFFFEILQINHDSRSSPTSMESTPVDATTVIVICS
jgi:hypothetical protein